jgi:hypothetical protein
MTPSTILSLSAAYELHDRLGARLDSLGFDAVEIACSAKEKGCDGQLAWPVGFDIAVRADAEEAARLYEHLTDAITRVHRELGV